jgi:hypothetical protein
MVEDVNHVHVTGHNPGVEVGIPMDWIFVAQAMIKRIGISEDFGIEEMVKA